MMFMCCCAKTRKGEDSETIGFESRLKNAQMILLEFIKEESNLRMKDIPTTDIVSKLYQISDRGEISKKDLFDVYKQYPKINQNTLKNFLANDFFYTDNTRQYFEFNKIFAFNILYTGAKDAEKALFLFNLLENPQSKCVLNNSKQLNETLEIIIFITCVVVAEVLCEKQFSPEVEQDLEDLRQLYTKNSQIVREFIQSISNTYLFPSEKHHLQRQDFQAKMEQCDYLFVKPHEIRKKYTEFVYENKERAMLPTKPIQRNNGYKESPEEYKTDSLNNSRFSARASLRGSIKPSHMNRKKNQNQRQSQLNDSRGLKRNQEIQKRRDHQIRETSEEGRPDKSDTDNSMLVYRYEDKSQRPTINDFSPESNRQSELKFSHKDSVKQQKVSVQETQQWDDTYQTPMPNEQQDSRREKTSMGGQNNIIPQIRPSIRDTSETNNQSMLSIGNLRKYPNVQAYLNDKFGEQFVNLVNEVATGKVDQVKKNKFKKNYEFLKSKQIEFPDYNSYPYQVREIFEYFNAIVKQDDLIEFAAGTYYKENIINLYFKILEKMSFVVQTSFNFQRQRGSMDLYNQSFSNNNPQKILYFNTGFGKKLNNQHYVKDCLTQLQNFFKYDTVLLPFFINEDEDQRCLLVSIKTINSQVDLYDREREVDNHDVSDTVLHMMYLASKIQDQEFNEDQIDGGVEGVCVMREEDMVVAVCYLAECITFGRPADLETFHCDTERQRILDTLLTLLSFK